jgi:phage gpG-like protein
MILFEGEGFDAVEIALKRLIDPSTASLRQQIARTSKDAVERRIETGKHDLNMLRWAPWSPRYAATRGTQHSLLVDTGDLLHSMEIKDAGLDETQMGTNIPYAEKNNNERTYMGLDKKDEGLVDRQIAAWIERVLS